MAIGLSPEHLALAESVAGMAARHAQRSSTRAEFENLQAGVWPDGWAQFRDLGLLSLHLPEAAGGGGAGLTELAVVLEAAGRALVPGPVLPTLLAGAILSRYGGAGVAETILPALAAGAAGCLETAPSGLTATRTDEGWSVSGLTGPVLGALSGEVLVLAAAAEGRTVWFVLHGEQVDGVVRKQAEGVDLTRDIGRLELSGVAVPSAHELDVDTPRIRAMAATLFAAEATGVARWCQATGLEYVKVREQFGRPVGSFQAIKHKCARLAIQVELMTAAVWDASEAVAEGEDQFALAAAAAAEICVQGAVDVALETVTLLGGIGYTWEHDVHLYWRRAMSVAALLGPRSEQLVRLGELALSVRRGSMLRLDEPDGLRERVAGQIERAGALPEPERRLALAEAGLVAPQYPAPWGLAVDPVGQVVIAQEFDKAGIPQPTMVIGEWTLPTIIAHGTDVQRERFIAPSLRGEIIWCQLFSEPGAGSDLASLVTRADKVDGGWRINGQKVWTSSAREADFAVCLARTDPEVPKHKGISYFLVDMRTPGVDVRPLREANGNYLFNEVYLEDVFVPDDCLVGSPGEGWRLARTTLGNERVRMGTGMGHGPDDLVALARPVLTGDRAGVVRDLGVLVAKTSAIEAVGRRALLRRLSGLRPGAEASMLKVAAAWQYAEVTRTVLGWHAAGAAVMDGGGGAAAAAVLTTPQQLIGGGTVEVQLNVISEHVLGLPRG